MSSDRPGLSRIGRRQGRESESLLCCPPTRGLHGSTWDWHIFRSYQQLQQCAWPWPRHESLHGIGDPSWRTTTGCQATMRGASIRAFD